MAEVLGRQMEAFLLCVGDGDRDTILGRSPWNRVCADEPMGIIGILLVLPISIFMSVVDNWGD